MAKDGETRRIGVHLGTTGGCWTAVDRAVEIGANTFQIFSSSPRMWRASAVKPADAAKMRELRAQFDVGPVAIHASYLINVCSQTDTVRTNSVAAFRGEVERALALRAEFLVLHPGSWKGLTREEGLRLAAQSIESAVAGIDFAGKDFHILIENTAGAEFSLGGKLEQVAELVERLRPCAPVAVCLDTCHIHVAGYDIVSDAGYADTMQQVGATLGFDTVQRLALQRRQGRLRLQARPPPAHRRGHHRRGALPPPAARRALRPLRLHRRNPRRRPRRRGPQRRHPQGPGRGLMAHAPAE